MRVGLIQLNGTDDPKLNLPTTLRLIEEAAQDGAAFVLTPEVTNIVATSRERQLEKLAHEQDDVTLAALRKYAAKLGVWILVGSLALKTNDSDGRFANRSIVIDPQGRLKAKYDKIHMFDVNLSDTESFQESKNYRAGKAAFVAQVEDLQIGMSICYDIRFSHLYRDLALAGANVIAVPAAISPTTGPAHIETLLRARAIETGCYVLMPSQTGEHKVQCRTRSSWGHSMAVNPWGEVIFDMGTEAGFRCLDIDVDAVKEARRRIPSLSHICSYERPINV
jgi:predicted amidohydrolase